MNTASVTRTRARTVGIAVLVAIFAAGILAGTAWTRSGTGVGGVSVNVQMSTELPVELRRLGLSKSQEDSVQIVLAKGRARMRTVLDEFEPRLRGTVDSVRAELREVLTADQRARFDALGTAREEKVEIDTVRR